MPTQYGRGGDADDADLADFLDAEQIDDAVGLIDEDDCQARRRSPGLARSTEARTQELRRLYPLFTDRMQEGDKQMGLGRAWQCPVLWIADETADMAISTRIM